MEQPRILETQVTPSPGGSKAQKDGGAREISGHTVQLLQCSDDKAKLLGGCTNKHPNSDARAILSGCNLGDKKKVTTETVCGHGFQRGTLQPRTQLSSQSICLVTKKSIEADQ